MRAGHDDVDEPFINLEKIISVKREERDIRLIKVL
jgi:hypothetical protein